MDISDSTLDKETDKKLTVMVENCNKNATTTLQNTENEKRGCDEKEDEDDNEDEILGDDSDDDNEEVDGGNAQFVSAYSVSTQPNLKNQSTEFFAVRKGRTTSSCIFLLENDFKEQVHNYTTAEYAKFSSINAAVQYIESDPMFVMKSSSNRLHTETDRGHVMSEAQQESWESMFIQLMYYHRTYSNTSVTSDCQPLYTWVVDQLTQYDKLKKGLPSTLTEGRVRLLLGLGFDFNSHLIENHENGANNNNISNNGSRRMSAPVPRRANIAPSRMSAVTASNSQNTTTTMRAATSVSVNQSPQKRLRPYDIDDNGNRFMSVSKARPTTKFSENTDIIMTTRTKASVMQPPGMHQLRHCTYSSTSSSANSILIEERRNEWNGKFAELQKFKSEHGHVHVDIDCDLGKWCARQLGEMQDKKTKGTSYTGPLTDDQARRLEVIGLKRKRNDIETRFYANIEKLKKYKEEHGHYYLPLNSNLHNMISTQKSAVSGIEH